MPDDESIHRLVAALSDSDYLKRAVAARELVNLKGAAASLLPQLLALRSDPNWLVRMQVPRAIIHLEATPEQALPILWQLLEDEDECVSGYAAWALKRLGQGQYAE